MIWWQKTLSAIGIGAVIFLAGFLVRMWTAPAPTETVKHEVETFFLPAVFPPAVMMPGVVKVKTVKDSASIRRADSLLAVVANKDSLLNEKLLTKTAQQAFSTTSDSGITVKGMLDITYLPPLDILMAAVRVDTIQIPLKFVTNTVTVVEEKMNWAWTVAIASGVGAAVAIMKSKP